MALTVAPGPLPAFAEVLRPTTEKAITMARLDALRTRRLYVFLLEMTPAEREAWFDSWGQRG